MYTLSLIFAFLIGLSLGLLGGGGSALAVPVFVYVVKYDTKTAICLSLLVVGTVSFFGSLKHWKHNNINSKMAIIFGPLAMLGAYIGARLAIFFSDTAQLILFASVMLIASYFMFTNKNQDLHSGKISFIALAPQGLFVGILSGLVGVGGGFLIVPSLVIFGKLSMKEAVGTSLVIITMNSITGVLGYLDQVQVPWNFAFVFTGIAIIGIYVGSSLVNFIPQEKLKKAFAMFILLMGIFILYSNL